MKAINLNTYSKLKHRSNNTSKCLDQIKILHPMCHAELVSVSQFYFFKFTHNKKRIEILKQVQHDTQKHSILLNNKLFFKQIFNFGLALKLIVLLILPTTIFSENINTKKYIESLYKTTSGFSISADDRANVNKHGSATYSEITYESLKTLLDDLKPKRNDVFFDLGSGVGKVTVQATLDYRFKKSFGIELSKDRHEKAEKIRTQLKKIKKINDHHNLLFCHQNIAETNLKQATIIFMCSTCYPTKLMTTLTEKFAKLKKGTKILTLKSLPTNNRLKLVKTYNLEMTWSKSSLVYLYKVV